MPHIIVDYSLKAESVTQSIHLSVGDTTDAVLIQDALEDALSDRGIDYDTPTGNIEGAELYAGSLHIEEVRINE